VGRSCSDREGLDCDLADQPGSITLFGTTLSAGSIDLPVRRISSYDNSSITSPRSRTPPAPCPLAAGERCDSQTTQSATKRKPEAAATGSSPVVVLISERHLTNHDAGQPWHMAPWYRSTTAPRGGRFRPQRLGDAHLGRLNRRARALRWRFAHCRPRPHLSGVVDVSGSLTVNGTYTQASGGTTNMAAR